MVWTHTGRLGALGGAAGALLVGAAVAVTLAAGGGDGGGTEQPVGGSKQPAGGTDQPADTTPVSEPEPEPDPLCVAQAELATAVGPIGDVDGPAELETTILAQLTFHTTAAEVITEPDAGAFRSVAGYYSALRDFYAERGWRPAAGSTDFGALPAPPADGSLGHTADILAERCDLARPTDNTVAP
jgi:hypothetical protein